MPKRAAADTDAPPNTRAKKAAKTDGEDGGSKKAKAPAKKAAGKKKTALSAAKFKSQALPIHVHLTHTPAPVEQKDAATDDPGFLGSLTLIATKFQTGSYGWKGTRKVEVELENPEEGQPKEKVTVQFQINATVLGSKGAKDDDNAMEVDGEKEDKADKEDKVDKEEKEAVEEVTEEAAEEVAED